jgi:hypothetical protein
VRRRQLEASLSQMYDDCSDCALGGDSVRLNRIDERSRDDPAPYEQDLRDRVLATYDQGKETTEIAGTIGVSPPGPGGSNRCDAKSSAPRGCRWAACAWSRWTWSSYAGSSSSSPTRQSPTAGALGRRGALQRIGGGHGPATAGPFFLKKTLHAAEQDRPDVVDKRHA